MAQGFKTGGRRKGTPNKRTDKLFKLLQEKYPDFDPVVSLVDIINDPYTSRALHAYCIRAILPYYYPKRKFVEVDRDETPPEVDLCSGQYYYKVNSYKNTGGVRRNKYGRPDYSVKTTWGYMEGLP